LIIIGLVAGFIARALVPGKQSMGVLQTILLGIVGSFVGGFLGRLLFHHGHGFVQTSSWIGSMIGSIIVLLIYLQVQQRRRIPPSAQRRSPSGVKSARACSGGRSMVLSVARTTVG
jgi:uncharacterized membrane protein YeaQ/YmgE (transglycosylase-associated protein family)